MKITFFCENCGTKLQIEDSLAGQKVRCPSCKTVVVVPELTPIGDATNGNSPASPSFSTTNSNSASSDDSISADDEIFRLAEDSIRPRSGETTNRLGSKQNDSSFVEDEGFSAPSPSNAADWDDSVSSNPYQPPKSNEYYGYRQPDDGMRLTKIQFGVLTSDLFALSIRYYKELLFLGLIVFLFDFAGDLFGRSATASSQVVSAVAGLVETIFCLMFYSYVIRLARTGETAFRNLKLKRFATFFKVVISNLFYGIAFGFLGGIFIAFCVMLFVVPLNAFGLTGGPAILALAFASIVSIMFLLAYLGILFRYMFNVPFILDRDAGIFKAFEFSKRYTAGNYKVFIAASTCWLLPFILLAGLILLSNNGFSVVDYSQNYQKQVEPLLSVFVLDFIIDLLIVPASIVLMTMTYLQMTGQGTIIREAPERSL